MLQKIKNFFIKLFCFFLISSIWAISMASYAEGGAEINGFFAFLLWLINLIILFKISAVASAIGSSILIIVLRITKFGFQDVVLYGLGIVAAMFGAIALFLKLMWRDNGGENNIGQQDTVKRKKQQYSKKQRTKYQGWDFGYNNFDYGGKEIEPSNSRGVEIKEEKEFYNIKDRNHSADCPHIYHKSSNGGQEPYYCGLRDCQISSDKYHHLCAYEWTAEKKCAYKMRENRDGYKPSDYMESSDEEDFYNIRDRKHSADCPHIYHKSSSGGQNPYYCGLRDCQISSDEYHHLCAYEWNAEKNCPYKKREH